MFKSCIGELQNNVEKLESLSQVEGLPAQHVTELNTVIQRLMTIANSNT